LHAQFCAAQFNLLLHGVQKLLAVQLRQILSQRLSFPMNEVGLPESAGYDIILEWEIA
jgi:hypothetical protein